MLSRRDRLVDALAVQRAILCVQNREARRTLQKILRLGSELRSLDAGRH